MDLDLEKMQKFDETSCFHMNLSLFFKNKPVELKATPQPGHSGTFIETFL